MTLVYKAVDSLILDFIAETIVVVTVAIYTDMSARLTSQERLLNLRYRGLC